MKRASIAVASLCLTLLACSDKRTPGVAEEMLCGEPFTAIASIQGNAASSPLLGQSVEVEGVVSGNFSRGLGGLFIQSASDEALQTGASSGLFVEHQAGDNASSLDGMRVRVRGSVAEIGPAGRGLTALISVSKFRICGPAPELDWLEWSQPPQSDVQWEQAEGMRVRVTAPLTLVDSWGVDRFGSMDLAFGGSQWIPTDRTAPGNEARALAAQNQRLRLRVDDGSLAINPGPAWYLDGALPPRLGTQFVNVEGIVDQRDGDFRLQLLAPLRIAVAAERPLQVPDVGGDVLLVNFNVENYFNGDGRGGGFPTDRGASSPEAFARQRGMVLAAMTEMDADLFGLVEIENDGFGPHSAIADLVAGLNADQDRYAFVDPGVDRVGSDAIAVGIVYRHQRLRPVGRAALLETPTFRSLHRVPLAQTFEDRVSGKRFTVVVNHFKSKGSCPREADAANENRGDGQSCWNAARVQASQALADWLQDDPTGSGSEYAVIMGDLNSYSHEDPLRLLRARGWVHLREPVQDIDAYAYSYVFRGERGSLDHTLVSPQLAPAVTGMAFWAINADEPLGHRYDRIDDNDPGRDQPWRSSDHNPQLVGLDWGLLP